jgi:ribosomal protein S18 acetylase RimI-like enzyme
VTVTVRLAGPGDAERLAAVGQGTFLESFAGELGGDDLLDHCARQHGAALYAGWLADQRKRLWLAEAEKGAPIGYVVAAPPDLPVPDPRPTDIEIKRIYVFHRFHGQGVGWLLLRAALDWAGAAGFDRALLGTYEANDLAIAFYRRVGFETLGTRKFRVGQTWCDDLVMGLGLG